MNNELLLVAFLAFACGYVFKAITFGFKTFSVTGNFVQKMGHQVMVLLGTAVYKMSYADQLCAIALEKMGNPEEAKKIRLDCQEQFETWKKEAVKTYEENYPENYKWQLKFDDWSGLMDELTDIYKEKKV